MTNILAIRPIGQCRHCGITHEMISWTDEDGRQLTSLNVLCGRSAWSGHPYEGPCLHSGKEDWIPESVRT